MEQISSRQASLTLTTNWELSIEDLLAEQAAGRSVLRSPHVGNMSPHNMALLEAGIPAWLVDYAAADTDRNYHTERVLLDGEDTRIARANGRLACRTTLQTDSSVWLDQYHNDALAEALPHARFETNTEYMRRHESVVAEVMGIVATEFPGSFDCIVSDYGAVTRSWAADVSVAEKIDSDGIMQLNDDHRSGEAVLMTNELSLLATFVVEALETGTNVQFHISGSAFYLYAYKNNLPEKLHSMYQAVRSKASFGSKLPEVLEVVIVPAANATLATTNQRREGLDSLVELCGEYLEGTTSMEADRREFFASSRSADELVKATFLRELKARREALTGLNAELAESLADCPEVIADRSKDAFVTQYDVIEEGGLYVAEANRTLTMRQHTALQKQLHQAVSRHSNELIGASQ